MTREPCGAKSVNEEPPRLLPSNKDILSAISDSLGVSEKERGKKRKDVCFSNALQNVGGWNQRNHIQDRTCERCFVFSPQLCQRSLTGNLNVNKEHKNEIYIKTKTPLNESEWGAKKEER